jgi:uracil-DNA glycosylase
VPPRDQLATLRAQAASCTACDLYKRATQTVFGAGSPDAEVMLVGEQPGDHEDQEGAPFVGPAGRMLDRALDELGVDRSTVYVTNAVKHFKWEPRGKRRIHQRPNRAEQVACRRWLEAELEAVDPRLVVCLGAVAAASLLGPSVKVTQMRGQRLESDVAELVTVTVHPSAVLRERDHDAREAAFAGMKRDLEQAFGWLDS